MKKAVYSVLFLFYFGMTTAQPIILEQPTPAVQLQDADVGSMAFGDIDNDGDNDLIITGKGGPVKSTLYENDGNGNFAEVTGTPIVNVNGGTVGFEDVNGDDFLDLLITGSTSSPTPTANLYLNDGTGNFILATGTPFEPSSGGDFAFGDVDNDGDKDVLITGYDASNSGFSKLYLNNRLYLQ